MTSNFYRAFEDRYRGSRDLIKDRLRIYLPFVQAVLPHYPDAHAVDIGCGRGEWLELLREIGVSAVGVDLDEGMLAACRERGLDGISGDGLSLLASLPDSSQLVVSGFHLAEHMPFADLQTLVQEALRVLHPAGLLILETPNPENLAVGSCHFYLDPSHQRPIPPSLLSFVAEHHGFARTKILRLQQTLVLAEDPVISLHDVIAGVSPDYSLVAQKGGAPELFAASDDAFGGEYGFGLEELARRYDAQLQDTKELTLATAREAEAKARQAETRIAHAESRAAQAELRANQAESRAQQAAAIAERMELQAVRQLALIRPQEVEEWLHMAEQRVAEAENRAGQAESRAQEAAAAAERASAQLGAVLVSTSWRVTKPLRWLRTRLAARPPK